MVWLTACGLPAIIGTPRTPPLHLLLGGGIGSSDRIISCPQQCRCFLSLINSTAISAFVERLPVRLCLLQHLRLYANLVQISCYSSGENTPWEMYPLTSVRPCSPNTFYVLILIRHCFLTLVPVRLFSSYKSRADIVLLVRRRRTVGNVFSDFCASLLF